MTASRHVFITPALDGTPTGGTLYDQRLILALREAGVRAERRDLAQGRSEIASGLSGTYWVDSLYLDAFPELARDSAAPAVGLLLHYLPSLVAKGDAWTPRDLTRSEETALRAASAVILPSPWLRDVVVSTGQPKERLRVVEPGVDLLAVRGPRGAPSSAPLAALLVGNLVPGKGVAPFLRALASCLGEASPRFTLTIAGDLEQDPPYAAECRALVRSSPALGGSVRFAASLPHPEILRGMRDADVLVSASRMESYGMALTEARAEGVPILARRGGNAGAHVNPTFGGELFDDDMGIASALVRLAGDSRELAERRKLAERSVKRRAWSDAARDFLQQS